MSTMTDSGRQPAADNPAPTMIHPGGGGWAPEPKITDAERMLYGEYAGIVRLLGQAAVAAENAYSLACKHSAEPAFVPTKDDAGFLQGLVGATWAVFENSVAAHREVAETAIARRRRYGAPGCKPSDDAEQEGRSLKDLARGVGAP